MRLRIVRRNTALRLSRRILLLGSRSVASLTRYHATHHVLLHRVLHLRVLLRIAGHVLAVAKRGEEREAN